MTTKVIQGEWEQSGTIIVVYGEHGGVICQMAEPRATHFVEFHPLELGSPAWAEQMENAKLITKAPEMLAVLKGILADVPLRVGDTATLAWFDKASTIVKEVEEGETK
jgi:hypothetical protein